jgi:hypothetical protein
MIAGMRLAREEATLRLLSSDHGVLGTVDAERGVGVVPVCFAIVDQLLVVPIDRVKPKASADLRRARDLDRDPRAMLLCELWDPDDWSRLWWVRALLRSADADEAATRRLEAALRQKYPQYRDAEFERLLVFAIEEVTGWSAT